MSRDNVFQWRSNFLITFSVSRRRNTKTVRKSVQNLLMQKITEKIDLTETLSFVQHSKFIATNRRVY